MTAEAPPAPPPFDWESAGRKFSSGIERLHAIAVLGSDDTETALVALGIGRQLARKRRVAIGDLLGDAPPLQALVAAEDPHGLADVFEYGVSLSRVVHRVAGEENLYVMPSGALVADMAEVMAHRRWSRLAAGFREQNGLLIVVASVATPNVEALVLQLDGAVLVGDAAPARLPVARVLGAVRGPQLVPAVLKPAQVVPRRKYVVRAGPSPWRIGAYVGVFLAVVIAAMGIWLAARPFARSTWAPLWLRGDTLAALFRGLDSAGIDSVRRIDSLVRAERAMGLFTAQDSASVAPYALSLVTFNTQAGALLELQRNGSSLRAGTFTPVLIRETPWFRVVAGAYPDSASAAALLDTLRARGMSDAGRVVIDRFPFALLVERDVPDSAVAKRVAAYQARRLPVYALLQSDRTARLFAGAFRTREEATLLLDAMRAAGVPTSLVYRTGSVY
ncbi:MAG: SPOR domain-containing protein [Gemmatimonadaceae bacterium]